MKRQIILTLYKGGETYIFKYEKGKEDELLDAVIDLANSGRTEFDWFDAAIISFNLTQSLIGSAEEILKDE